MDNNSTITVELASGQLAEFLAITKDLANTVGMHGDLIDQQRKIVEEHDAALVMDTQRLDAHEQQIKADRISRATLADQLTAVSEWVTKKLAEQNSVIVDGLDARFCEMGMRIEALAGDVQADRERSMGHAKACANVLEEHDKRLDDCGSALAGFDKRIRKLEWGGDKAPAPDAVKALVKRLEDAERYLDRTLDAGSQRVDALERPEEKQPVLPPAHLAQLDDDVVEAHICCQHADFDRESFVQQLAIALSRVNCKALGYGEGSTGLADFRDGARWLLAVARNARP